MNLINSKINHLTILDVKKENKRKYYLCECDLCSSQKWIRADSVKSGKQMSCGCLSSATQFKKSDLTGQRFGRLTVIKQVGKKDGRYIWECRCDCGNTCNVESSVLVSKKKTSCGCYKIELIKERRKLAFKAHLDKNIIDNTNVSIINREKPIKSNKSGVTGVSWDASRNKWVAQIWFQNKYRNLGRFDKKEDAIRARKEAEENLHKKFLETKGLLK